MRLYEQRKEAESGLVSVRANVQSETRTFINLSGNCLQGTLRREKRLPQAVGEEEISTGHQQMEEVADIKKSSQRLENTILGDKTETLAVQDNTLSPRSIEVS